MIDQGHIRAAIERFYADVWNQCRVDVVPQLMSSDVKFRGSLGASRVGREGFISYLHEVQEAIAGFSAEIEDLVVEPPKAFARVRFFGTHTGSVLGFPGTGLRVEWQAGAFFDFTDEGLMKEVWVVADTQELAAVLRRMALQ
jgi:steroid delta-isomerase-like uncharacterized protein